LQHHGQQRNQASQRRPEGEAIRRLKQSHANVTKEQRAENSRLRGERDFYASAETAKHAAAAEQEHAPPFAAESTVCQPPFEPALLTGDERWPYAGHCLGLTVHDIVDDIAERQRLKQELDAAQTRVENNRKYREDSAAQIERLESRRADDRAHASSPDVLMRRALARAGTVATEDVAAIMGMLARGAQRTGAMSADPAFEMKLDATGRLHQSSWKPGMKQEFGDMCRLLAKAEGNDYPLHKRPSQDRHVLEAALEIFTVVLGRLNQARGNENVRLIKEEETTSVEPTVEEGPALLAWEEDFIRHGKQARPGAVGEGRLLLQFRSTTGSITPTTTTANKVSVSPATPNATRRASATAARPRTSMAGHWGGSPTPAPTRANSPRGQAASSSFI